MTCRRCESFCCLCRQLLNAPGSDGSRDGGGREEAWTRASLLRRSGVREARTGTRGHAPQSRARARRPPPPTHQWATTRRRGSASLRLRWRQKPAPPRLAHLTPLRLPTLDWNAASASSRLTSSSSSLNHDSQAVRESWKARKPTKARDSFNVTLKAESCQCPQTSQS